MSKLLKLTLLLALAVVLFGAYRYSAAQETNALATKHILEGTYINSGVVNAVIVGDNYESIDTQLTVPCPGTSGTCTIQADMWVQNGEETTSGNVSRVCLYVDGSPVGGVCPVSGETPLDGSLVQTSNSQAISGLAHGNHTVQTFFWVEDGAFVGSFTSTYHVYKP